MIFRLRKSILSPTKNWMSIKYSVCKKLPLEFCTLHTKLQGGMQLESNVSPCGVNFTWFLHLNPLKLSILGEASCIAKIPLFHIHCNKGKTVSATYKNCHRSRERCFLKELHERKLYVKGHSIVEYKAFRSKANPADLIVLIFKHRLFHPLPFGWKYPALNPWNQSWNVFLNTSPIFDPE